jgi:hypothetical protein
MSDPSDRRQHRRFSLRIPVAVLGENTVPRSRDLSETGLFVELSEPRPVGSPLPLRLVHPKTGEAIPAVCKIVRHAFASNGSFVGVGLRFANNDDVLGDRVRALLTELAGAGFTSEPETEGIDVAYAGTLDAAEDHQRRAAPITLSFRDVAVTPEESTDYNVQANLESLAAQVVDPYSAEEGIDVDLNDLDEAETRALFDSSVSLPMVWPDTVPVLVLGANRSNLTPDQHRILAFIDGNNAVTQVAHGAGIGIEEVLAELARLARRGLVLLPEPTEAIVGTQSTPAAPKSTPGKQLGLWDKARACVTEALAAERAGRPQDAARLLEQALTLRPPNAADIHARLALMGLGPLEDLDFAEQHARAAAAFSGDRPQIRRLLRAVRSQRARAKRDTRNLESPAVAVSVPAHGSADPTGQGRRRFAALVAGVCILAVGGFNVRRYILPWRNAPEPIEARLVAELVPATKVILSRNRLVVTVGDRGQWVALADKQQRVEQLAEWARSNYGVGEVLVADATPLLLARFSRGKATVYR